MESSSQSQDGSKKAPIPDLYCSKGFTIEELLKIYEKYCRDLSDPEDIWIEGYDEFLEYRSDLEIRKSEWSDSQTRRIQTCDEVVLKHGYAYIQLFGEGLYDDSYREKRYPLTHWWWYLDRIKEGSMPAPDLQS